MAMLISRAIAHIQYFFQSLFQRIQQQRFLAIAFVGFILLTTSADPNYTNNVFESGRERAYQQADQRPKSNREWASEPRHDPPMSQKLRDIPVDSVGQSKDSAPGKRMQNLVEKAKSTAARVGKALSE